MNKLIAVLILILPLLSFADSFDDIKKELSKEGCWHFLFVDVVESDIFNSVDSTDGEAYLSSNGSYYIKTNEDFYIYDLINYYSYSPESNQLVIEKNLNNEEDEISFITNLDKYYKTVILDAEKSYSLYKKENVTGDIPDSLVVIIDSKEKKLKRIEYYDINEELNKLIFIEQNYIDSCLNDHFIPKVPDSTERVKL